MKSFVYIRAPGRLGANGHYFIVLSYLDPCLLLFLQLSLGYNRLNSENSHPSETYYDFPSALGGVDMLALSSTMGWYRLVWRLGVVPGSSLVSPLTGSRPAEVVQIPGLLLCLCRPRSCLLGGDLRAPFVKEPCMLCSPVIYTSISTLPFPILLNGLALCPVGTHRFRRLCRLSAGLLW